MSTWKDEVKRALINLGGEAPLKDIYDEVRKITDKNITRSYRSSVRESLERDSSDSKAYNGKEDIFYSKGIGTGIWGLREKQVLDNRELIRYNKYSRREIHDMFSPNSKFVRGSGYWGISGIIKVPETKRDYIFLVTYGQKQASHEFEENIDENGVLTWQSQPSQSLKDPQIQDFINHDDSIDNIYLFLRTDKKSDYTYLGLLSYVSHDNQREKPVYFKWQIIDWDENKGKESLENLEIHMEQESNNINKDLKLILKESDEIYYRKSERKGKSTEEFYSNRNIDFEGELSRKSELGRKGEEAVVKYEKDFLIAHGRSDLAKNVHRTSEINGNAERFDVLSYEVDGTPKYIEVKTTKGSATNKFHISESEVNFSHQYGDRYYLYRVYNLNPKNMLAEFIIKPGPINRDNLTPTNYTCKIDTKK